MRLKQGVRLKNLAPEMGLGAVIIDQVFARLDPNCSRTVTSCNDSQHGRGSLHHCLEGKYTDGQCRATDWRTKDFAGDKLQLKLEVKAALGDDFDVVLEDHGGDNEHLHAEYDPK